MNKLFIIRKSAITIDNQKLMANILIQLCQKSHLTCKANSTMFISNAAIHR